MATSQKTAKAGIKSRTGVKIRTSKITGRRVGVRVQGKPVASVIKVKSKIKGKKKIRVGFISRGINTPKPKIHSSKTEAVKRATRGNPHISKRLSSRL